MLALSMDLSGWNQTSCPLEEGGVSQAGLWPIPQLLALPFAAAALLSSRTAPGAGAEPPGRSLGPALCRQPPQSEGGGGRPAAAQQEQGKGTAFWFPSPWAAAAACPDVEAQPRVAGQRRGCRGDSRIRPSAWFQKVIDPLLQKPKGHPLLQILSPPRLPGSHKHSAQVPPSLS